MVELLPAENRFFAKYPCLAAFVPGEFVTQFQLSMGPSPVGRMAQSRLA